MNYRCRGGGSLKTGLLDGRIYYKTPPKSPCKSYELPASGRSRKLASAIKSLAPSLGPGTTVVLQARTDDKRDQNFSAKLPWRPAPPANR